VNTGFETVLVISTHLRLLVHCICLGILYTVSKRKTKILKCVFYYTITMKFQREKPFKCTKLQMIICMCIEITGPTIHDFPFCFPQNIYYDDR
jgi:hypothetical protein